MKKLISIILAFTLLFGCTTFSGKKEETLRVGVYATQTSIEKGRIDLADKYISEVARIVPPPKRLPEIKRVTVSQATTRVSIVPRIVSITNTFTKVVTEYTTNVIETSTNESDLATYIVVPDYLTNMEVLVVNSKEYNSLLESNRGLKKQVEKEQKDFQKYSKRVDDYKRDQEREMEKARAELAKAKKGWGFWKKIGLASWLFPIAGIALLAACILNPAIIPIVVGVFGKIIEIGGRFVKGIVDLFGMIVQKISEWRNK